MTKQLQIAACDHGACVLEQRFDRVPGGSILPFVAVVWCDPQDHPRDLLLGRTGSVSIDGLQHSAMPGTLLARQSGVRRDDATVDGSQEPVDRCQPVEAIKAERHERGDSQTARRSPMLYELEALTVAKIVEDVGFTVAADGESGISRQPWISDRGKGRRRLGKNDRAGIGLREPEHASSGRCVLRVHREIATPTAARSCRSADADQRGARSMP